jgi:Ran GTPase-activating protein (RanGAP) involved in mRNA processing and transport
MQELVDMEAAQHLETGISKNRSLKTLTLKLQKATTGALRVLLEAVVKNPCLISLDLSHTAFPPLDTTPKGLALDPSPLKAELLALNLPTLNLKTLKLSGCRLVPLELSVVASCLSRPTCPLTYLDLSGNSIPQSTAMALASALKTNTSICSLKLAHCSLGDIGIEQLAVSFAHNTTLGHLNLSSNDIGPEGAKALARGIENSKSLGHLNLSHNPFQHAGLSLIFASFTKNDSLREVDIGFCQFSASTWSLLSQNINAWVKIWKLNLSGNMAFTAATPSSPSSSSTPLGSSASPSTCDSPLRHTSISFSRASLNQYVKALEELCSALQVNSSISILDLSHNTFSDAGCKVLASTLASNSTLVELKLRRCGITSRGVSLLADSTTDNFSLGFVDITGNEADSLGHLEANLHRNRKSKFISWRPVRSHPIVQAKPHAEFTSLCPVPSTEEIWVACTDGHVHFWPVSDSDNIDDVMHYVDVHAKPVPVTRRRINAMVACKSTVWVLTDESTIVVISQSQPHRISYVPMADASSERLCMTIIDKENQIAVIGGGSGDVSLWKTQAGEESMIKKKTLGSGFPIVAIASTPTLILAGMVMPGRHSSFVVILDHALEELYRQEVDREMLSNMTCFGNNLVVTTFQNHTIRLWHCDSREMAPIRAETHIPTLTLQAVGEFLITSSPKRSNLCVWSPTTLNAICTIETAQPVKSHAILGDYMAVLTDDELVSFWSA